MQAFEMIKLQMGINFQNFEFTKLKKSRFIPSINELENSQKRHYIFPKFMAKLS